MSIVIVNVIVPSSGDGPIANIADLIGEKTVELSGYFEGRYTLMGSQDDILQVQILTAGQSCIIPTNKASLLAKAIPVN